MLHTDNEHMACMWPKRRQRQCLAVLLFDLDRDYDIEENEETFL